MRLIPGLCGDIRTKSRQCKDYEGETPPPKTSYYIRTVLITPLSRLIGVTPSTSKGVPKPPCMGLSRCGVGV